MKLIKWLTFPIAFAIVTLMSITHCILEGWNITTELKHDLKVLYHFWLGDLTLEELTDVKRNKG